MPNINFSKVLVLSGSFGPGSVIPNGTTFTSSHITISDLDSGGSDLEFLDEATDTDSILAIGGVSVGAVPSMYFMSLNTDAGTILGVGFTFAGQTYFVPENVADISTVSSITGGSASADEDLNIQWNELFIPHDAFSFTGTAFYEEYDGTDTLIDSGTADFTAYDYDNATAATGSIYDQMYLSSSEAFTLDPDSLTEGTVTLSHSGGILAGVRVVQFSRDAANDHFYYLFDEAQLSAAGVSINDIIGIATFVAGAHTTDQWEDLGLNLQGLEHFGTSGDDIVVGTSQNDTFYASAGADSYDGADRHGRLQRVILRNNCLYGRGYCG